MSVRPPAPRLCLTSNTAPSKVAFCTAPLSPTAVTTFTLPLRASMVEPTGIEAPSCRGAKSSVPGVFTSIDPACGAAPTVEPRTGLSESSGSTTTGIWSDPESPEPPPEGSPPFPPSTSPSWPEPEPEPEFELESEPPDPEPEPEPEPEPDAESPGPDPESPEPDPESPELAPPESPALGGFCVVNETSAPRTASSRPVATTR